jgi:hypothetical protein
VAHLARRYINRWLLLPNPSCLPFFVPPPPLLCPVASPPGLLCPPARGSQRHPQRQAAGGGRQCMPVGASRVASHADTAPHRGSRPTGREVRGRSTAVRSEEAEHGPLIVAVEVEQGSPVPAPVEVEQESLMSASAPPMPPVPSSPPSSAISHLLHRRTTISLLHTLLMSCCGLARGPSARWAVVVPRAGPTRKISLGLVLGYDLSP